MAKKKKLSKDLLLAYKDFIKEFPEENPQKAIDFFVNLRFPDGIYCLRCNSRRVAKISTRLCYRCNDCQKQFSPFSGTVLEKTRISYVKWLYATKLLIEDGTIKSNEIADELNLCYSDAWFLMARIREIIPKQQNIQEDIFDPVEVDEIFIGSEIQKWDNKRKKKLKPETKKLTGRDTKFKVPVIGMVSRKSKKRAFFSIPDLRGKTFNEYISPYLLPNGLLFTDNFRSYKVFHDDYQRYACKTDDDTYVDTSIRIPVGEGGFIIPHTNTIEGEFGRLVVGLAIHRGISYKHIDNYLNAYSFTKNNKDLTVKEKLELAFSGFEKRITYKELTSFNPYKHNHPSRGPKFPTSFLWDTRYRGAFKRKTLELMDRLNIVHQSQRVLYKPTYEQKYRDYFNEILLNEFYRGPQPNIFAPLPEVPNIDTERFVKPIQIDSLLPKKLIKPEPPKLDPLQIEIDKYKRAQEELVKLRNAIMVYFEDKPVREYIDFTQNGNIRVSERPTTPKSEFLDKLRRFKKVRHATENVIYPQKVKKVV